MDVAWNRTLGLRPIFDGGLNVGAMCSYMSLGCVVPAQDAAQIEDAETTEEQRRTSSEKEVAESSVVV